MYRAAFLPNDFVTLICELSTKNGFRITDLCSTRFTTNTNNGKGRLQLALKKKRKNLEVRTNTGLVQNRIRVKKHRDSEGCFMSCISEFVLAKELTGLALASI